MKRRKILVLIPMLGLFLTGCTFQEGFATAKHWVGQNIYHPAKDFIEGLIGKKDNKEEEQKPSEDGGKQDGGDQTEVKYTVKFQAGGGSGTMADVADVKGEYVLPACTFTAPEGKEFAGWKVGEEVKAVGEKITVSADVTLVATWKDKGEEVLTSIEDVYAAALAGSTDEFTFKGVVTGTTGNSFYVQQDGHGMYIYNKAVENLAVGKEVKVTSTLSTYKQSPQTNVVSNVVVGEAKDLPTPISISGLASIGEAHVLANVQNAVFKSKDAAWAAGNSGHSAIVTFDIGGDDIVVKFDKYGYDADKAALLNNAVEGDIFNLANVFTAVNEQTKQIGFAGTSTISKPAVQPTTVIITSATEMFAGGQLSLSATVGPQGASQDVSWEIVPEGTTAEGAAIANGVLTAPNAGTVIVKATATGTEVSKTASITVTASDKQLVTSIVADPAAIEMTVGDEPVQIATTVSPSGVEEEITWTVTPATGVVSVSDGLVTAVGAGEATIRIEGAESHNGVTVPVSVSSSVKTIEEAYNMAVAAGTAGTTDAITFAGTVVALNGTYFYLQTGDYGMFVRPSSAQTGVAVGKVVQVTAKVGTYNGLVETINNGFVSAEVVGEATVPSAASVSSKAELANLKHNVLVNLQAKLVTKPSSAWSATNYVRPTFSIGDDASADAITFTLEKSGFTSELGPVYNDAQVGDVFTFTNVITSYFNAPQCTFVEQSTMAKKVVAPGSVSITSGSEVGVGSQLQLTATVGPSGAPQDVEWSIVSGGDKATLSGSTLTGVADGTVTVSATATGTEVSSEMTITVSSSVVPPAKKYATKITSVSEIVSGEEYYIGYETGSNSYIFNGTDAASDYTSAEVTSSGIEQTDSLISVVISTMEGGYSLRIVGGANDGKYIYGTSGQNKLNFGTSASLNTISFNDGLAEIISNTSIFVYNSNSGQTRFRYYKPGTVSGDTTHYLYPCVYKLSK